MTQIPYYCNVPQFLSLFATILETLQVNESWMYFLHSNRQRQGSNHPQKCILSHLGVKALESQVEDSVMEPFWPHVPLLPVMDSD